MKFVKTVFIVGTIALASVTAIVKASDVILATGD